MSKTVNIYFVLNNQNFKKVIQCSKSEVEDGELATIFDIEEFKKQIRKILISGDVVDYDELCKMITESFNVRVYKRAYIIECEMEIEIETKEVEEVEEEKQTIYHNENSDWYLISDNYVDAETIEEEGIDLTKYNIVKIESSETGNNEVDDDFYVWECQDGVFYLEEEGCFERFESLEKLIRQFEFEKDLRKEEVEYYDLNANVNYDEFI